MGSGHSDDIYAETLSVFDRRDDQYEPLTTPEVADALDAQRRTVHKRLSKLAERGELATKETGSNARVWWRTPDGATDASAWTPERQSRALATLTDGVGFVDPDGIYQYVNEQHARVYGYERPAEFVGEHWEMCYTEAALARFEDEIFPSVRERGGWRGEATGKRADGTTFPQELSLTATDDGGLVCVVRDITDRKETERQVREARHFNEELVENAPFGMFRLDEELRITYENPRAEEIIGLLEEKEQSDAIGVRFSDLPPVVETGQAEKFDALREGETVEFDFPFESIYGKRAYFTGRAVPVYRDGEFDGAILMATDISERRQYERELETRREQLAALDELNSVVRGITEAVIEQSTRAEIEQTVCDRLAESDSYRFAWVATADTDGQLTTRVAAAEDRRESETPFATLPTDENPTTRAIQSGEMQVRRNAQQEPETASIREHAREHGYRSLAVIPVTHQGVVYGALGVVSERPDAFAEAERAVVGQLGDVVGHAIAAVDRKRALVSDEVVELDLRLPDLPVPAAGDVTDDSVEMDRLTPLGDGEYLLFGRAGPDGLAVLERLHEELENWGPVRTLGEDGDEMRFEQRLADAPVASVVADHGGYFVRGSITDGGITTTVQLPPETDVRWVVELVRETYPDATVTRQQQLRRDATPSRRVADTLDLTERQRAAIEAGYFGGYFDTPRQQSGAEIAASLGIRASTFHQHVRKAERKLFEAVLTER
ncbi:bacterio-opsin activator domain-containing protein [Haloarcula litorea]|uniref:bacterio-opsin activator domain-containing protein n=1 Tax=Haloarcula litorea TaxID=3032579 RepID=UPI0023E89653|nr:bacterio-opsin activator domain-containing protein [Halomicroarcula sp. GDY20]